MYLKEGTLFFFFHILYQGKIPRTTRKEEAYVMYRYVITLGELKKLQEKENVRLVDVRDSESYRKGHIPEAVSIPYSEEPDFFEKFQKTGTIVICCDRGNLSAKVTLRMRKAGYQVYSLAGGYEGYRRFQK